MLNPRKMVNDKYVDLDEVEIAEYEASLPTAEELLQAAKDKKIKELRVEAGKRRDVLVPPDEYFLRLMKAIKTLNKKSKNNATQEEIEEIDSWELVAGDIEAINVALGIMVAEVDSFTSLQKVEDYLEAPNPGWPV